MRSLVPQDSTHATRAYNLRNKIVQTQQASQVLESAYYEDMARLSEAT